MITKLHRFLVWVVLLPVVCYRRVISPLKRAPSCRFLPTCSEYAIEAVNKRGVVVGGALARAPVPGDEEVAVRQLDDPRRVVVLRVEWKDELGAELGLGGPCQVRGAHEEHGEDGASVHGVVLRGTSAAPGEARGRSPRPR